jgi:AraC-like DNA-binding protein/quercetin dioxygenase-like cupin family protein
VKVYLSEKMFKHKDFPLAVTLAPQKASMPPHRHDFIEIVFVARGHSIHRARAKDSGELSYGIIQGDVFSVMPGDSHEYSGSKNLQIYNIALQKSLIDNESGALSELGSWGVLFNQSPGASRGKTHLPLLERADAEQYLKKAQLELSLGGDGFRLAAKTAFLGFLITAARAAPVEWKTVSGSNKGVFESLSMMEEFSQKPFDLESFARAAAMSVSSYTKKFRDSTGLSPLDYFTGLRMEKVRRMLTETDLSLNEIAFECGFSDTSYMIKLFRVRHGLPPGKYRSIVKAPASHD